MTPLEQYDACAELYRAGKTAEVAAALQAMTETFPDFPLPYNCLAAMYKKENKVAEAIAHMQKYCALEPNDPFGFSVLSAYCIEAGMHAEAEAARDTAFTLRFQSMNPPENR